MISLCDTEDWRFKLCITGMNYILKCIKIYIYIYIFFLIAIIFHNITVFTIFDQINAAFVIVWETKR